MSKPSSREHRECKETSLSADELQRELEEDLKFNLTTTDEDVSFISDTKLNMTSETTLSSLDGESRNVTAKKRKSDEISPKTDLRKILESKKRLKSDDTNDSKNVRTKRETEKSESNPDDVQEIKAHLKRPCKSEIISLPAKPSTYSFVRAKLVDCKPGIGVFMYKVKDRKIYGTFTVNKFFVDGQLFLKDKITHSREIAYVALRQFIDDNKKPVFALMGDSTISSREVMADGTIYPIECKTDCIWVGYNAHQSVTLLKETPAEVTERERATFSGVEASVDECSPTFCKLNILPPHPLFGHKVLLERKNFFVKGLPMLYSASHLNRVLSNNVKVFCYIAPRSELMDLPSDCSQCELLTYCSFAATLAWRGPVPDPTLWFKPPSPRSNFGRAYFSKEKVVQGGRVNSTENLVILKINIAFKDQAFILGEKGLSSLKSSRLEKEISSLIRFPTSKCGMERDYVTVRGDIKKVEKVRTMLREMLPIYLEFEVPRATFDASSTSPSTFSDLETKFGVQISHHFKERGLFHTAVLEIVGSWSDAARIDEGSKYLMSKYFGPGVNIPVTLKMDIIPGNYDIFCRSKSVFTLQEVSQKTQTIISFRDPLHPNPYHRGPVRISGTFRNALAAVDLFKGYSYLNLEFSIPDGSTKSDLYSVMSRSKTLHRKPMGSSVIVKAEEMNVHDLYQYYKKVLNLAWDPEVEDRTDGLEQSKPTNAAPLPKISPIQALTRRLMGSSNVPAGSDAVIKSCKELELALNVSQKLLRALEKVKSVAAAKAEEIRRESEQREIKVEPFEEESEELIMSKLSSVNRPIAHFRKPPESVFHREKLIDSRFYSADYLSGTSTRHNDNILQRERTPPDFGVMINPFHTLSHSDQSWSSKDNSSFPKDLERSRTPDMQARRISPDFDTFQNPFASQETSGSNRIGRTSPDFTIPLNISSSRKYDRNGSKERQSSSFDDLIPTNREERPAFYHDQTFPNPSRQLSQDRDIFQDRFEERSLSNFDTHHQPNRDFLDERQRGQNLESNFPTLSNSQRTQNLYPDPYRSGQLSPIAINLPCPEKQSKANDILEKAKAKLMAKRLKSSEQLSSNQFKDSQREMHLLQSSFSSRPHFAGRESDYFGNQSIPDQVRFNPSHSQAQTSSTQFLNQLSDQFSSRVFKQEFPDHSNAKPVFSQNLPLEDQNRRGAEIKKEKPEEDEGNPIDWDKLSFILNSAPNYE